jgi:glycosyltransferase involved in cell wall biosynthesis
LRRNCLIVSYYFPPAGGGGVQRWVKFIKYLSKEEWRFTVIAARPDYILPEDKTLLRDIPDQARIIRIAGADPAGRLEKLNKEASYWKRWISAFIHITDSRAQWNSTALSVICNELNHNQYDAIIITIPPYSLAGLAAILTLRRREPVVLDMRDPWSINPYKIYPTCLHRVIDQRREFNMIQNINFLISAYHSVIDYYYLHVPGFRQKKSVVIPNGYDEADLPEKTMEVKTGTNVFKIAFSGTFYSHLNHPGNFLKAMQHLNRASKSIHFYHFGKSAYDLRALAKKYHQNTFFHAMGYLPHSACLQQLMTMDAFLVVLDNRVANADKTIGGKVYEYLALKKPILALVPDKGEAANLIRTTDSGIVCDNSNIKQIVDALQDLVGQRRTFQFKEIEHYKRRHQALQLKRFLEEIVTSDRSLPN